MVSKSEMANDEIKAERDAFVKQGIADSQLAQVEVMHGWLDN